jgi:PEP-CTERM motif
MLVSLILTSQFGSTTNGESWLVFASNSPTSGFVQVASGSDELVHTLVGPVSNFYYFKENTASGATLDNVLLAEVSGVAAVPEPGTWAMMLLGFVGLASRFGNHDAKCGLPKLTMIEASRKAAIWRPFVFGLGV